MTDLTIPTFDEWLEYSFTQGYSDFVCDRHSPDSEAADDRLRRFAEMPPEVVAPYMIKLFGDPAGIADRYTDHQIAGATWFLFGVGSCYFGELLATTVSPALQVDVISSVGTVYTELFDHVCCQRGADPDGHYANDAELDTAVYMIWDMGGIDCAADPEPTPSLAEPCFSVLESVLTRCRTSSCLISALHGLSEVQYWDCHCKRAMQVVDAFLDSRTIPDWLREYALQARVGAVQ